MDLFPCDIYLVMTDVDDRTDGHGLEDTRCYIGFEICCFFSFLCPVHVKFFVVRDASLGRV